LPASLSNVVCRLLTGDGEEQAFEFGAVLLPRKMGDDAGAPGSTEALSECGIVNQELNGIG
jgi:hypothetical protein